MLSADRVLVDLEEELCRQLSQAKCVTHEQAGRLGDVVLWSFEAIRKRHHIGRETTLHVPLKRRGGRETGAELFA